jgi:hypothetical protein
MEGGEDVEKLPTRGTSDDEGAEKCPPRPIAHREGHLRRRIIKRSISSASRSTSHPPQRDSDRRQLKISARLGLYRRVEG